MKIINNIVTSGKPIKSFKPGTVVADGISNQSVLYLVAETTYAIGFRDNATLVVNLDNGYTFFMANDTLVTEVKAEMTVTALDAASRHVYLAMRREWDSVDGRYVCPDGKISAIKAVRALMGYDLMVAKNIVDTYVANGEQRAICTEDAWNNRDMTLNCWNDLILL